jgi:hypothetical protein
MVNIKKGSFSQGPQSLETRPGASFFLFIAVHMYCYVVVIIGGSLPLLNACLIVKTDRGIQ